MECPSHHAIEKANQTLVDLARRHASTLFVSKNYTMTQTGHCFHVFSFITTI
jgi:hypothetical protein